MPNNKVPRTGTFNMFLDEAVVDGNTINDTSIESSVRYTIVSGSRPARIKDFSALRTNCVTDMVDSTYGIRGAKPKAMIQFRGYPRVPINFDWVTTPIGGPGDLRLECKMNFSRTGVVHALSYNGYYNLNNAGNTIVTSPFILPVQTVNFTLTNIIPDVLEGDSMKVDISIFYSLSSPWSYFYPTGNVRVNTTYSKAGGPIP